VVLFFYYTIRYVVRIPLPVYAGRANDDIIPVKRGEEMITGKQRAYLKSLANGIPAVLFIGKEGLTDNIITEADRYLEARELMKAKLQEGCDLDAKETANIMADELEAEFVQAIGRTFVLYRRSLKEPKIEL